MNSKGLRGTVPKWDFFSFIIIASFAALQIARWRILPQFIDIYYHLLTGWGFLQAGGYSSWDFWQYAPVGRPHIYPPFFHFIIAFFLKLGASPVILAKLFELVTPVLFLAALHYFLARNYGSRFAFFALLVAASSFSFYMNLINHIPAALAMIFGIFCLQQLLHKRRLPAVLLLALAFYTHIGISWFFALTIAIWGLFNKESRRFCFSVFIIGIILASPILVYQLVMLKAVTAIGLNLSERFICQFKILEYILAACGVFIIFRHCEPRKGEAIYRLFLAVACASFIFLLYPYRLFSAEGFFAVILLSATSLDYLCGRLEKKNRYAGYLFTALCAFIFLIVSPTLLPERKGEKLNYKLVFNHSAFMGMFYPMDEGRGFLNSIWFEREYLSAADFIKRNSGRDGIIYSNYDIVGVCLASLSQRRTANALFPEIKPAKPFEPLAAATVVIVSKDDEGSRLIPILDKYGFSRSGETKLFIFYLSPPKKPLD